MKKSILKFCIFLFSAVAFSQAGHIMQGVGSVNMSMGGAATAQPLDISGALHWNPASISVFDDKILKLDVGLFFSSPELYSKVPEFDAMGQQTGNYFSGTTEDDRGTSIMPALAFVWGKEDSKHTFGASAFGISGFGVTFPESNSNPINMPQNMGGFGHIESDYMLLQVGIAWAYQITDEFSIGIQPNVNYGALELAPNPLASPDFPPPFGSGKGYPTSDKASAIGYGAQIGIFYDSKIGLKLGASYKTNQKFGEFTFKNTYLDGTAAPDVEFQMDYPAIASVGAGYSIGDIDLAVDFRRVFYENTEGFEAKGWQFAESGPMTGFPTGAVNGFGWKDMSILSVGLQYKGINKLPLRFGYTYSSNPIDEELTFFSIPATAIIKNAFQFGFSYKVSNTIGIDAVYHYGDSDGKTSGNLLRSDFISENNPYGAIDGSEVSYEMTTSMVMVGIRYTFNKKEANAE